MIFHGLPILYEGQFCPILFGKIWYVHGKLIYSKQSSVTHLGWDGLFNKCYLKTDLYMGIKEAGNLPKTTYKNGSQKDYLNLQ